MRENPRTKYPKMNGKYYVVRNKNDGTCLSRYCGPDNRSMTPSLYVNRRRASQALTLRRSDAPDPNDWEIVEVTLKTTTVRLEK